MNDELGRQHVTRDGEVTEFGEKFDEMCFIHITLYRKLC
jgi:hypothetical protein